MEKIGRYSGELLKEISNKIAESYNLPELHNLCLTLSVDSEEFPKSKKEFINEFVLYFARRNRLKVLVKQCQQERPNIIWPTFNTRKAPKTPPFPLEAEVAELAYRYFAERYGIGYDTLRVKWTIQNDGSAEVRRIVKIEAYSKISTLDTFLLVPEQSPQGENRQSKLVRIDSLTPGKQVTLTDKMGEGGRTSFLITITPPLLNGENVEYQMIENLPPGVYAIGPTKQQRQTPYDYGGWTINRPTKHLFLEVHFPEKFGPDTYNTEVRYATTSGFPSIRHQSKEEKLVGSPQMIGPEAGHYHLQLEVSYPVIGLIYILRWYP